MPCIGPESSASRPDLRAAGRVSTFAVVFAAGVLRAAVFVVLGALLAFPVPGFLAEAFFCAVFFCEAFFAVFFLDVPAADLAVAGFLRAAAFFDDFFVDAVVLVTLRDLLLLALTLVPVAFFVAAFLRVALLAARAVDFLPPAAFLPAVFLLPPAFLPAAFLLPPTFFAAAFFRLPAFFLAAVFVPAVFLPADAFFLPAAFFPATFFFLLVPGRFRFLLATFLAGIFFTPAGQGKTRNYTSPAGAWKPDFSGFFSSFCG